LLHSMEMEHALLEAVLVPLSEEEITRPMRIGEWAIKDILTHITWWERRQLRLLRGEPDLANLGDGNAQAEVQRINARTYAENHERPLADVRAAFSSSYEEIHQAITEMPEEALADQDRYNDIAGDTFRHYAEHREAIHAWLDQE
nr:DinB family protein [Ktedonobacterales bacterium]